MAYTLFYSLLKGQFPTPQNVVVATTTQASDVQLEIDITHAPTVESVIIAMRAFEQILLAKGIGTATGPTTADFPAPVYPS